MTLKRHSQDFEVTECSDEDSVIDKMVYEKLNISISVRSYYLN